jgi:hypothetical protein
MSKCANCHSPLERLPDPSCLQADLSPAAAYGVKRVQHLLHAGELPGPACCFCPQSSTLSHQNVVLVLFVVVLILHAVELVPHV